jgi:hypothetical protein
MAGAKGLEPSTSAVTGQRSNQLSYAPAGVECTDLRRGLRRVKKPAARPDRYWRTHASPPIAWPSVYVQTPSQPSPLEP